MRLEQLSGNIRVNQGFEQSIHNGSHNNSLPPVFRTIWQYEDRKKVRHNTNAKVATRTQKSVKLIWVVCSINWYYWLLLWLLVIFLVAGFCLWRVSNTRPHPPVPGWAFVLEVDGHIVDVVHSLTSFLLASPWPRLSMLWDIAVDIIRMLKISENVDRYEEEEYISWTLTNQ